MAEVHECVTCGGTHRKMGPRKKPEEHPACPHCGGRIHFSMAGAAVNFECLWRQYCVAHGMIADPSARLPLFTIADAQKLATWGKSLGDQLTYGKMDAAGGAVTYADLRALDAAEKRASEEKPKRTRAKKETPVPVAFYDEEEELEDEGYADDIDEDDEEPELTLRY